MDEKIAVATVRILASGNVLTKNGISKVVDLESKRSESEEVDNDTSKPRVKFNRNVLPLVKALMADIFHYEVVDLKQGNGDLLAINKLPASVKALKYSFNAKNTVVTNDLKQILMCQGLPRPGNNSLLMGKVLFVILVICVYGGKLRQSELEEIIEQMGPNATGIDLNQLEKQMFIKREMMENGTRVREGYDSGLVNIQLGARTITEWDSQSLMEAFKSILTDQWNDKMERRCQLTLNKVFED